MNKKIEHSVYLKSGSEYWTLTPMMYTSGYGISLQFKMVDSGVITMPSSSYHNSIPIGLRPSISLKKGTFVKDGDGTYLNPYVIE